MLVGKRGKGGVVDSIGVSDPPGIAVAAKVPPPLLLLLPL
jgi:hypothetical protein